MVEKRGKTHKKFATLEEDVSKKGIPAGAMGFGGEIDIAGLIKIKGDIALGDIYFMLGRYEEAALWYKIASQKTPNPEKAAECHDYAAESYDKAAGKTKDYKQVEKYRSMSAQERKLAVGLRRKIGGLEQDVEPLPVSVKVAAAVFAVLSFLLALFLLSSNLTGFVVSDLNVSSSFPLGIFSFLVGLALTFVYLKKR